jgi:polysaccharide pyruvyl transferase WcaK-like protein
MQVLIDQSAYDLLNLGDVAMLQACATRLRTLWPDAEISAISYAPDRLATYCPGVTSIGGSLAGQPIRRGLRGRYGWASTAASVHWHGHLSPRATPDSRPRTAAEAVRAADLVVASGGGYLTDAFWRHAVGVLSVLSLAQRLQKPTAMFGQGIDSIRSPLVRRQARGVLPRLAVLGLREGVTSPDAALCLGADRTTLRITGDEALELLPDALPGHGDAIGFNIRMAGYAGTASFTPASAAQPVLEAARKLGAPIVALPISRYSVGPDLGAIEVAFRGLSRDAEIVLEDLTSPHELITATARCRVVVTGSYHAAVFGLGLGIPAVCLTRTPYYNAKFRGLQDLFSGLVTVIPIEQPDLATRLRAAVIQAWDLPANLRAEAQAAAAAQREAGRNAYRHLRNAVDAGYRPPRVA